MKPDTAMLSETRLSFYILSWGTKDFDKTHFKLFLSPNK